jgi:hypothetical protein
MLLVFLPLRDVVEMILARRLRRQEEQIRRHELTAAWISAIGAKDATALMELVKRGADPNVTTEGECRTCLHGLTPCLHCLQVGSPPSHSASIVRYVEGLGP